MATGPKRYPSRSVSELDLSFRGLLSGRLQEDGTSVPKHVEINTYELLSKGKGKVHHRTGHEDPEGE